MSLIDKINSPADLKKLGMNELKEYVQEARRFLIDSVSKTGGHLASSLGVAELIVALHYVFDLPKDKIIWDVGHQSYVHKLITGRKQGFKTLRKFGGMAGFPKTGESEYDFFNTGHSSTSISAALGMAHARDLNGDDYSVVAVIGDGALTGGMAYEALSDAGQKNNRLIVILNDNEMSISENVGAVAKHLNNMRSAWLYNLLRDKGDRFLSAKSPMLRRVIKRIKNTVKYAFMNYNIFEALGFRYLGPYDGHNINELVKILSRVREIDDNVLLHVITKKGKGYSPAERQPQNFHGVGEFEIETGSIPEKSKDYSAVFGDVLCDIAEKNKNVVAVTAAMPSGTGLTEFALKYPDRFFDVGIAEQHAVTMAAGMAISGYIPVFAVYSSFLQRAYDQLLHDVALQNLHVVLAVDRAGVVGEDGETHQGIYDLSYLTQMPGMTVIAPSCFSELEKAMNFAVSEISGPVAVRYPRGIQSDDITYKTPYEYGKGEILTKGEDVLIIAAGRMVSAALQTAEILKKDNITSTVIDVRFVKPIDKQLLCDNIKKIIVTIEDNITEGGLGSAVREALETELLSFGFNNEPVCHGGINEIFEKYRLTPECMAEKIKEKYHG